MSLIPSISKKPLSFYEAILSQCILLGSFLTFTFTRKTLEKLLFDQAIYAATVLLERKKGGGFKQRAKCTKQKKTQCTLITHNIFMGGAVSSKCHKQSLRLQRWMVIRRLDLLSALSLMHGQPFKTVKM